MMDINLDTELKNLNKIAKDYDDGPFDRIMRTYMMRSLAPFLVPGKALEMGCFNGAFTRLLSEVYTDLTVVDAVESFLDNVKPLLNGRIKTACSLFEKFETSEKFDAVFIAHVLEHIEDPISMLQKVRHLLAPNGRVYLIVPNGLAASRQIAVKMG